MTKKSRSIFSQLTSSKEVNLDKCTIIGTIINKATYETRGSFF